MKTQISLGFRPVWSESSPCALWVAMDPKLLHADSKDSDLTGRMPRLIWVFAACTVHVGFVALRLINITTTSIVTALLRVVLHLPSQRLQSQVKAICSWSEECIAYHVYSNKHPPPPQFFGRKGGQIRPKLALCHENIHFLSKFCFRNIILGLELQRLQGIY